MRRNLLRLRRALRAWMPHLRTRRSAFRSAATTARRRVTSFWWANPHGCSPPFSPSNARPTGNTADWLMTWRGRASPGGVSPPPFSGRVWAGARTRSGPGGARFRTVVTGIQHVCALTDSGHAYCWGVNEWGQVGAAGQGVKTEPTPVAVAAVFGKLSSGRTHTCGVTTVGELFCWGLGTNNALGPAGTDRCTVLVEDRPHHPEPQPTPCARTP